MIRIINNSIYMTRGDSASIHLDITDMDEKTYTPEDDDTIMFTMKKSPTESAAIFQKKVEGGIIKINPEDTQKLDYGRYVYDIQLKKADGATETIIPPHIFKIQKEVTF